MENVRNKKNLTPTWLKQRKGSLSAEPLTNAIQSKLRILVVDDNIIFRQLIRKTLTKYYSSYISQIEEASDPIQALKMLSHSEYDLIFMDIDMPKLTGIETTLIIRGRLKGKYEIMGHNKTVPIIAITTNSTKDDRLIYMNAGFNGLIGKPFKYQQFKEIFDSLPIPTPFCHPNSSLSSIVA